MEQEWHIHDGGEDFDFENVHDIWEIKLAPLSEINIAKSNSTKIVARSPAHAMRKLHNYFPEMEYALVVMERKQASLPTNLLGGSKRTPENYLAVAVQQLKKECELAFMTHKKLPTIFSGIHCPSSASERTKVTNRIIDDVQKDLLTPENREGTCCLKYATMLQDASCMFPPSIRMITPL